MRYRDGRVRTYDSTYDYRMWSPLWSVNWRIKDAFRKAAEDFRMGYVCGLMTAMRMQKFTIDGDDFVCVWQNGKVVSIVYIEEDLGGK